MPKSLTDDTGDNHDVENHCSAQEDEAQDYILAGRVWSGRVPGLGASFVDCVTYVPCCIIPADAIVDLVLLIL